MNLAERGARVLARGGSTDDVDVARAEGSLVYDRRGRKYVDLVAWWCVGNFGWRNAEIDAAFRAADPPHYVAPFQQWSGWVELAERLVALAPGDLARCWRATGGSEAVDIALQLAMSRTGRHRFVSIEGSYHGNTIGTRAVADDGEFSRRHRALVSTALAPPLDERAAGRLETQLARRDVAAVILEPVAMNLGVLVPDPAFVARLVELCHRNGTLVIADEVACGFGRTGARFGCDRIGLRPDLLCLGKALSNGIAGIGACLATEDVADAAEGQFWSTYGWHPLATEAALATLAYFERHEHELLANAQERGRQLRDRLLAMDLGEATIRVEGLAVAAETDAAGGLEDRAREAGVLVAEDEGTVSFFPALTIDAATLDEGLDRLQRALGRRV